MDYSLTEDQEAVRQAIQKCTARFDDEYWLRKEY